MYMRAIATLSLQQSVNNDSADAAAQTELDLSKYFVNPGKREMKAVLSATLASTDSGTFNYKLQHSTTTVDSDFSDISGASFTQVENASPSVQSLHFFTNKRYVRGYQTIAGGANWAVTGLVFAVKLDA